MLARYTETTDSVLRAILRSGHHGLTCAYLAVVQQPGLKAKDLPGFSNASQSRLLSLLRNLGVISGTFVVDPLPPEVAQLVEALASGLMKPHQRENVFVLTAAGMPFAKIVRGTSLVNYLAREPRGVPVESDTLDMFAVASTPASDGAPCLLANSSGIVLSADGLGVPALPEGAEQLLPLIQECERRMGRRTITASVQDLDLSAPLVKGVLHAYGLGFTREELELILFEYIAYWASNKQVRLLKFNALFASRDTIEDQLAFVRKKADPTIRGKVEHQPWGGTDVTWHTPEHFQQELNEAKERGVSADRLRSWFRDEFKIELTADLELPESVAQRAA